MKTYALFLVLSLSANSLVTAQTLVPEDSLSVSLANGGVAGFGDTQGDVQTNINETGSAAGASGSVSGPEGAGSVVLSTEGFVYPNQLTASTGLLGSLLSTGEPLIIGGFPGLGVVFQGASASTTSSGSYVFLEDPAPAGYAWVASGRYLVNLQSVGGLSLSASVGNPAMNAGVDINQEEAFSRVEDVLNGTETITFVFGGEAMSGNWSTIVAVGENNPFEMGASVNAEAATEIRYSGSKTVSLAASANIIITGIELVELASLPPMRTVTVFE